MTNSQEINNEQIRRIFEQKIEGKKDVFFLITTGSLGDNKLSPLHDVSEEYAGETKFFEMLEEAFEEDLKTIADFYRSHGFLDVEVRRGAFIYEREKGTVSPVIEIKEGTRYRISEIELRGYRIFRKEELMVHLGSYGSRHYG